MGRPLRALIVEDVESDAALLLRELKRGGFDVTSERVETSEALAAALEREAWDVVISDYSMPGLSAPAALELVKARGLDLPFLIVSGSVSEEIAVEAIRAGAHDFMAKGKFARLIPAIDRAMREAAARRDRQRLEQQLRQTQKMEAIGRLAGGVAHDFNNMLSIILSYADTIVGDLPAGNPIRADVEEMRAAALRATDLTRQLLAFSRQQVLEPRVLDLSEIVAAMEVMLRRLLGAGIELTTVTKGEPWSVKADPGQIEQVVMNLAVNARDAMPRGGKLTIEVVNVELDQDYADSRQDVRAGAYVMLAVSDTGDGMDAATLAMIFEPFFTTKEVGKGTGLGLATVFGIVKQSGGHIAVHSELGAGTIFRVYLPRVHAADVRPSQSQPVAHRPWPTDAEGAVQAGGGDARPMTTAGDAIRLLLVDDDPGVRRALQATLVRHGILVETASNGREAADKVKRGSFDVIVTDISMPEMTGIEFLKAVREHDIDVPVILITGQPDIDTAVRAVEYGAFRYLAKPVSNQQLRETVVRAATLHKLARLKKQALELPGQVEGGRLGERAALEVRFTAGLRLMWMAFQPIVEWRERRVFGYEALLRSDEPLMKSPADILDAAERLGRLHELGRNVRAHVARAASALPGAIRLFVNLHSADLNDEDLYSPDAPLSKIAGRVVLEVTERASLHGVKNVTACVAKLNELGFQIAIDDLGAGYAGLTSFTQLGPAVAKLDMSLVRGVDSDPRRQSIVRSMKTLCDDLGMLVVAEGVETPAERDMLAGLGCDLLQGYLFAKPARGFDSPRWPA
jgi:EAL domain-containing protein (putative c-di-GMP-specific phosphodiesterase class I)/signal transduction histidine kinase